MPRNLAALIAASLLGVIAVAALVTGVFFVFGAWATQETTGSGTAFDIGSVAATIIGVLTIGYAAFAGFAARDAWLARARGAAFGLIVGIVAILAAAVALLEGRSQESAALLYIAAGLGAGTVVAVLVAALNGARASGASAA